MKNTEHKTIEAGQLWFPLDNAAKIFPAIISDSNTAVFRITAFLYQPVRIAALMKVVSATESRFPYYKVRLKKGFFWYYLEHTTMRFSVETDDSVHCRKFGSNKLLFRIIVVKNRITIEFSHILTDGAGALEYLKTILILYTKETGQEIKNGNAFLRPGDSISEEEFEDSYDRYFKENLPPLIKRPSAFHIPWGIRSKSNFSVQYYVVPLNSIKTIAAEKAVTITDYLVAAYLYVLQEIYEEEGPVRKFTKHKHIRIQVPVNLRKIFPSVSMRNFSLFVLPELDLRLGHYSFEEILKSVYHQIRIETDAKLINKNISRNVGPEKKIFVKSIPLFIKSLILRKKFYSLGASQYSGVLTNLGKVDFPCETEKLISWMVFTPPPPNKVLKINCGMIGIGDNLVLCFGNITRSEKLHERIADFLRSQGIVINLANQESIW